MCYIFVQPVAEVGVSSLWEPEQANQANCTHNSTDKIQNSRNAGVLKNEILCIYDKSQIDTFSNGYYKYVFL